MSSRAELDLARRGQRHAVAPAVHICSGAHVHREGGAGVIVASDAGELRERDNVSGKHAEVDDVVRCFIRAAGESVGNDCELDLAGTHVWRSKAGGVGSSGLLGRVVGCLEGRHDSGSFQFVGLIIRCTRWKPRPRHRRGSRTGATWSGFGSLPRGHPAC